MSDPAYEARLAAVALHGAPGVPVAAGEGPLAGQAWDTLLAGARSHRLTGLLAAAVQDGVLVVTDEQQAELDEVERVTALHVVQVERLLLALTDALDGAGIGSLVLKGPSLAHTVYAAPELRPFGDVDVLVRSADLDRALAVLGPVGIGRKLPELRPGFDRRFAKGVTCEGPGGLEVDLHRSLAAGPLARVLCDDALFALAAGFDLAGRPLRRLDDVGAFLHACVHLVLGAIELRVSSRDLVQLEAAPGFDAAAAADLARRWQLSAVVVAALERARTKLGLPAPWAAGVSDLLDPTPAETDLLALYPREVGNQDPLTLGTVRGLPGVRDKAAFVAALAWPSAANLRSRDLSRWSHVRELLGRVGRPHRR